MILMLVQVAGMVGVVTGALPSFLSAPGKCPTLEDRDDCSPCPYLFDAKDYDKTLAADAKSTDPSSVFQATFTLSGCYCDNCDRANLPAKSDWEDLTVIRKHVPVADLETPRQCHLVKLLAPSLASFELHCLTILAPANYRAVFQTSDQKSEEDHRLALQKHFASKRNLINARLTKCEVSKKSTCQDFEACPPVPYCGSKLDDMEKLMPLCSKFNDDANPPAHCYVRITIDNTLAKQGLEQCHDYDGYHIPLDPKTPTRAPIMAIIKSFENETVTPSCWNQTDSALIIYATTKDTFEHYGKKINRGEVAEMMKNMEEDGAEGVKLDLTCFVPYAKTKKELCTSKDVTRGTTFLIRVHLKGKYCLDVNFAQKRVGGEGEVLSLLAKMVKNTRDDSSPYLGPHMKLCLYDVEGDTHPDVTHILLPLAEGKTTAEAIRAHLSLSIDPYSVGNEMEFETRALVCNPIIKRRQLYNLSYCESCESTTLTPSAIPADCNCTVAYVRVDAATDFPSAICSTKDNPALKLAVALENGLVETELGSIRSVESITSTDNPALYHKAQRAFLLALREPRAQSVRKGDDDRLYFRIAINGPKFGEGRLETILKAVLGDKLGISVLITWHPAQARYNLPTVCPASATSSIHSGGILAGCIVIASFAYLS